MQLGELFLLIPPKRDTLIIDVCFQVTSRWSALHLHLVRSPSPPITPLGRAHFIIFLLLTTAHEPPLLLAAPPPDNTCLFPSCLSSRKPPPAAPLAPGGSVFDWGHHLTLLSLCPSAGLDLTSVAEDPSFTAGGGCGQRMVQEEPLDAILSPELDKMVTDGENQRSDLELFCHSQKLIRNPSCVSGAILSKLYKIPGWSWLGPHPPHLKDSSYIDCLD